MGKASFYSVKLHIPSPLLCKKRAEWVTPTEQVSPLHRANLQIRDLETWIGVAETHAHYLPSGNSSFKMLLHSLMAAQLSLSFYFETKSGQQKEHVLLSWQLDQLLQQVALWMISFWSSSGEASGAGVRWWHRSHRVTFPEQKLKQVKYSRVFIQKKQCWPGFVRGAIKTH